MGNSQLWPRNLPGINADNSGTVSGPEDSPPGLHFASAAKINGTGNFATTEITYTAKAALVAGSLQPQSLIKHLQFP
jgi:hypothetical protein